MIPLPLMVTYRETEPGEKVTDHFASQLANECHLNSKTCHCVNQ